MRVCVVVVVAAAAATVIVIIIITIIIIIIIIIATRVGPRMRMLMRWLASVCVSVCLVLEF